jgi:hypothetical protein
MSPKARPTGLRTRIILTILTLIGLVLQRCPVRPGCKALVYVNAFVPDQGESVLGLQGDVGDPSALFDFVQYPGAPAGDVDLYVKQTLFPQVFAADLPVATRVALASAQRPITLNALLEPSGAPAWKALPSLYLLGTRDNILPPRYSRPWPSGHTAAPSGCPHRTCRGCPHPTRSRTSSSPPHKASEFVGRHLSGRLPPSRLPAPRYGTTLE